MLVTHDQDEALSVADRVAVLRDGRMAQYAAPQELYDRPADADVARFVGEANLIDGKLTEAGVETVFGLLPVRSGDQDGTGPVTVLLRPEQLEIEAGRRGPAGRCAGADHRLRLPRSRRGAAGARRGRPRAAGADRADHGQPRR